MLKRSYACTVLFLRPMMSLAFTRRNYNSINRVLKDTDQNYNFWVRAVDLSVVLFTPHVHHFTPVQHLLPRRFVVCTPCTPFYTNTTFYSLEGCCFHPMYHYFTPALHLLPKKVVVYTNPCVVYTPVLTVWHIVQFCFVVLLGEFY